MSGLTNRGREAGHAQTKAEGGYLLCGGKDVFVSSQLTMENHSSMHYAFDTISLDSLQTRPCNFFIFFLVDVQHSILKNVSGAWFLIIRSNSEYAWF